MDDFDDNIEEKIQASYEKLQGSNVVWKPQLGSQTLFLTCPIYEVLYEGTRGSQKTDSLIMDFAKGVGKGYGAAWRGILFRETYPQLDHIIAKTKQWYYQIFPTAKYNEGTHTWRWSTGEELLLRHMSRPDDYWDYHGHEYPWIGWDDLTNWATPECYEAMKACCRSSTPGIPRRYRANTNPHGKGHSWVKAYFIDPAPPGVGIRNREGQVRVRIHGSIEENLVLLEVDPDYIKTLDSIKDSAKRKAWRWASWDVVAGGAIDDVWEKVRRVVVISPFEIPTTWRVDRSFDWGSTKPFSVGWWAESDGCDVMVKRNGNLVKVVWPPKSLFRIAEWYGWNGKPNEGCRMLASEVARRIKETEKKFSFQVHPGPADPSIWTAVEGDSYADKMARQGIKWLRADNSPGSRKAGLETLREYLGASAERPMENPGLFVFDTCTHFIRTIPSLPRDSHDPDDVDTDAEDHVYDETRYRLMHRRLKGGMADVVGA